MNYRTPPPMYDFSYWVYIYFMFLFFRSPICCNVILGNQRSLCCWSIIIRCCLLQTANRQEVVSWVKPQFFYMFWEHWRKVRSFFFPQHCLYTIMTLLDENIFREEQVISVDVMLNTCTCKLGYTMSKIDKLRCRSIVSESFCQTQRGPRLGFMCIFNPCTCNPGQQ